MSDQRGGALIETALVGLFLLIPLVWLLIILADVHRGALATTTAAREAGADAARESSLSGASRAVERAVAQAFFDHRIAPGDARIRWSAPSGLGRGASIGIEVSYPVEVLQIPFLGRVGGPAIWVNARHVTRIDPYRSREP